MFDLSQHDTAQILIDLVVKAGGDPEDLWDKYKRQLQDATVLQKMSLLIKENLGRKTGSSSPEGLAKNVESDVDDGMDGRTELMPKGTIIKVKGGNYRVPDSLHDELISILDSH